MKKSVMKKSPQEVTEKGLLRLSKADLSSWRKIWLKKLWKPIFLAERTRKQLVTIVIGEVTVVANVANEFREESEAIAAREQARAHRRIEFPEIRRYMPDPKFHRYVEGRGQLDESVKILDFVKRKLGCTRSQLAELLGVPESEIADLERGRCQLPWSHVFSLAAACEVSAPVLFWLATRPSETTAGRRGQLKVLADEFVERQLKKQQEKSQIDRSGMDAGLVSKTLERVEELEREVVSQLDGGRYTVIKTVDLIRLLFEN